MRIMQENRFLIYCLSLFFFFTSCGSETEEHQSGDRLQEHINWLASPEREGRLAGTLGEADAANYLTDQFIRIGVSPFGDGGTYLQQFVLNGPVAQTMGINHHLARNVTGVVNGGVRPGRYIVVGAHYDGSGNRYSSLNGNESSDLLPFATDNASGTAGMLWLAEHFAAEQPDVSIIFTAFSGNVQGRLGSGYFVRRFEIPRDSILAMVNIGQLQGDNLSIAGTASSDNWQELIARADSDSLTAVFSDEAGDRSDHTSFLFAGIPALHYDTVAEGDTRRGADVSEPGEDHIGADGGENIRHSGMIAVLDHAKRVIEQISRTDPHELQFANQEHIRPQDVMNRNVRLGVLPDYAFTGVGFRIEKVTPGSLADSAGMEDGDIIKELNGVEITGISGYIEVMSTIQLPATVQVAFVRHGTLDTLEISF